MDDTTPYSGATEIPTVISELKAISTTVFNWFDSDHIKANPGKCQVLKVLKLYLLMEYK